MQSGKHRFVNDDGGPGSQSPNEYGFDRQIVEWFDEQAHHLIRHVAPPAKGNAERRFPKFTDGQNEEPAQAQRSPVDELKRDPGEEQAWHNASRQEEEEIARERSAAFTRNPF